MTGRWTHRPHWIATYTAPSGAVVLAVIERPSSIYGHGNSASNDCWRGFRRSASGAQPCSRRRECRCFGSSPSPGRRANAVPGRGCRRLDSAGKSGVSATCPQVVAARVLGFLRGVRAGSGGRTVSGRCRPHRRRIGLSFCAVRDFRPGGWWSRWGRWSVDGWGGCSLASWGVGPSDPVSGVLQAVWGAVPTSLPSPGSVRGSCVVCSDPGCRLRGRVRDSPTPVRPRVLGVTPRGAWGSVG